MVNKCCAPGYQSNYVVQMFRFPKNEDLKQTLVNTIEQYISNNSDDILAVYYTWEDYDTTLLTYLFTALGCFSDILLNTYSKIQTDKLRFS